MATEDGAMEAATDLNKVMEALRATRDLDTCLRGLKQLRSALRGDSGIAVLEAMLHKAPELAELHAIWDSQLAMKDDRVAVTLILVLLDILNLAPLSASFSSAASRAADALAAGIVTKRIKALYFLLGSDQKDRVNAALALMTALVKRGCARDLVRTFDFDVPAFGRAARAPRQGKGQEEGGFPPEDMHALWMCDAVPKRVTRSLFVDFGLALLETCDASLLATILPVRPLFGGLLLHLHQHPPHIGAKILEMISARVLSTSVAVPPRLKAEPFGDAVLTQLANLAALDGGEAGVDELAAVATNVLMTLGSDPSVGLCPTGDKDPEAGGGRHDSHASSGWRRLMRLLSILKPTKTPRHFQLLTAITERSADVAAAFIASAGFSLEPRLDTQWLAGMALVSQVTQHAARLPLPFLALAQRGEGSPAMDSGAVRGLLRRMLPTTIPKVHLSRGLQSASPLVRYVTLCTLRRLLSGVAAALSDLSAATAFAGSARGDSSGAASSGEPIGAASADSPKTDQASAGEPAGAAWDILARNFWNAVRARVPDVKALQGLLATLDAEMTAPAYEGETDEQVAVEMAVLRKELGEPVHGALSAPELSLAALLGVLTAYQRCIPAAVTDANFDPARLLAKGVASWAPLLQHGLLELLTAASESPDSPSLTTLYSPTSLQVLLKLAGSSTVPQNSRLARQLLQEAVAAAVGFESHRDEVLVWLQMLPEQATQADRSSEAVAGFLVEAVTSVVRRPHEMFELAIEHSAGPNLPSVAARPLGFSLLAVAALAQAFRVVRSEKMPSASRAAIAGYVAGVLAALIQVQQDPTPLCRLTSGLAYNAAVSLADKSQAGAGATGSKLSSKKRWWDESSGGGRKLQLPREGCALASLEAFARSQFASQHDKDLSPALKKRKLSASVGSTKLQRANHVIEVEDSVEEQRTARFQAILPQTRDSTALQALLLTNPARLTLAHLPQLAAICQDTLEGDFGPLLTAIRAHTLNICAGQEMQAVAAGIYRAGTAGGTADKDSRACGPLLDACPFLVLAHAACATPGLMDPATRIGHRLLESLQCVPPEGQAVILKGLLFWASQLTADKAIAFACELAHASLQASCTAPEGLPSQQAVEALLTFAADHTSSAAWTTGVTRVLEWLLPRTQLAQNSSDALLRATAQAMTAFAAPFLHMLGAVCVDSLSTEAGFLSRDPPEAAAACARLALFLPLPLLQQIVWSLSGVWKPLLNGTPSTAVPQQWAALAARLIEAVLIRRAGGSQYVRALAVLIMHSNADVEGFLNALERSSELLLHLGKDSLELLEWCMRERSAASVQLAARLISTIPACAMRFAALLAGVLHEAGTASATHRREAIAMLLPASLAYLQQLPSQASRLVQTAEQPSGTQGLTYLQRLPEPPSQGACQTAEQPPGAQGVAAQQPGTVADGVAVALRDPLMAYLSRKGKGTEAELSAAAVEALTDHTAGVLIYCLRHHPLPPEQALKLFQRITLPTGWLTTPSKSATVHAARQKASVAAYLLQGSLSQAGVHDASPADRGASAYDEAVVRYAMACMGTLAEATLKPTKFSPDQAATEVLQAHLLHDLDTYVGDAIAESRAAEADPTMSASLAQATQGFAAAVLRYRFQDAEVVRSLRRFLAALLPNEEDGDNMSEGGGLARPPAGSSTFSALAFTVTNLLLDHSRFEDVVLSSEGSALPAVVANLVTPLTSLLGLVDSTKSGVEACEDVSLRKEVLELLETLLDLHTQYSEPGRENKFLTKRLQHLLPQLLGSYGATLSAADRALLRVLLLVDDLAGKSNGNGDVAEQPGVASGSLLAQAGYLWGEPARKLHAQGALLPHLQPFSSVLLANRRQLTDSLDWVDQRRCALTLCHFPESRTLAADEAEPQDALPANVPEEAVGKSQGDCLQAAGYDPAYVMRFCTQALRETSVGLESFAAKGLLSLCLRCLACEDSGLRGLAYEAVALYSSQLNATSFRDKQQLGALLRSLQLSVTSPFQRLPAVIAVFLAEASTVLLHPGSTLYPHVNKLLTRRPRLKLEEVPLMAQLWMSGVEDAQAEERAWLLRLLAAGLQGPLDGDICRKRFVGELVMSLHGSPLADSQLHSLSFYALCQLPNAPAYAGDLVLRAGLVPWFTTVATSALRACQAGAAGAKPHKQSQTAAKAVQALRRLLHLRDWGKQDGQLGPLADFGRAAQTLCQSLTGQKIAVWPPVLSLVTDVLRATRETNRKVHRQPGRSALMNRQVFGLLDVEALLRNAVPLMREDAEPGTHRLGRQLLDAVLLVTVHPASAADQQSFTAVSQWAISTAAALSPLSQHALPPRAAAALSASSRPVLPPSAAAELSASLQVAPPPPDAAISTPSQAIPLPPAAAALAWLSQAVLRGAMLEPATPAERARMARQVLALHAAVGASDRLPAARAAAVVALHLLQPLIAAELGVGDPLHRGWLSGGANYGHADGEEGGGQGDVEKARGGAVVGNDGADARNGSPADAEVNGAVGEGALGQEGKYLLGNTLLRLLDLLDLPRFGGRGSGWPVQRNLKVASGVASTEDGGEGRQGGDGVEGAKVAEVVLLMLREVLAGLEPQLTMLTFKEWAAEGSVVAVVGEAEIRHAELAGLRL